MEPLTPEDYCELCGKCHFHTKLTICGECEERVFPDLFECSECLEDFPAAENYGDGLCIDCFIEKVDEEWDQQLMKELSAYLTRT